MRVLSKHICMLAVAAICVSEVAHAGLVQAAVVQAAVVQAAVVQAEIVQTGKVISATVAAPSLANNLLGDSAQQQVFIYLPPGYEAGTERYPVLFLLHGFSLQPTAHDWSTVVSESMPEFIANHRRRG